jgi:hypothetical protein
MHVSGNELSFQQEHLQKSAPGLCTLIYRVKSTEYTRRRTAGFSSHMIIQSDFNKNSVVGPILFSLAKNS